ncbi:lytic transglycosylase domain-containing protein [Acinetobacter nectaris]|uniref:lytic transglycosylase domain-containing protein n=1 Tax=Acinetobacter nectaris TaxID=1219382 RepID=UPI001F1C7A55|nr:lytic transglycosylase domain-containing protein [Acinetobacter nectaris]MCF9034025.1 lytic transglycosylase domain-containing protein [Acinetobacter nectaris]
MQIFKIILPISFYIGLNTFTHAGHIYTYEDSNGSYLFTNQPQANQNLKAVKVTYYPDSNIHSYRNWGGSEASVLPSFSKNKNIFDDIISSSAQKNGIPAGLIKAIMHTESGFNIHATSPVGAQGLMQLMPATAKRFHVKNSYDPNENIHGAAQYLSTLLKRFNGNTPLVLAAYNAGEGNVQKYGGVPPFRETKDYIKRVLNRYNNLYHSELVLTAKESMQGNHLKATTSTQPPSTRVAPNTKHEYKIVQLSDGTYTSVTVHN